MPIRGIDGAKRAIDKSFDNAMKEIRGILLTGFSQIIINSPVDTGRLRGNWFFSSGSRNRTTSMIPDKSGQQSLLRLKANLPEQLREGRYYYQNNLIYAARQEYGNTRNRGQVRRELVRIRAALAKKR